MHRRAVGLGAAALALVLAPDAASAQPVSHLSQPPAEHVVLLGSIPGTVGIAQEVCSFARVTPDADPTARLQVFEIPPGRRLVITDVEWEAAGLLRHQPEAGFHPFEWIDWWPDTAVVFVLGFTATEFPRPLLPVFQSRSVLVSEKGAAVAGNEELTTGVVVAPGTLLCGRAHAVSFDSQQSVLVRRRALLTRVILRGYLIDES